VSETFVATAMLGLLRHGHEIDVISQHRPWPGEPVHDEVRASGLLERTTYVERPLSPDSPALVRSLPFESGRHDVVHAHFGPNARRFLFAREQAGAPLVVTFHGYDFSSEPARNASMYSRLFAVADTVTFNCEHARKVLETLGCPPRKLRPLRISVDLDTLPFRERRLEPGEAVRILTVGRLVEKKGHEIALRALALARPALPNVRYDIVGGGPLVERLEKAVERLGLDDVVRLHGMRDSVYVRRLLAEAHLFLLASTTASNGDQEGTPVVLAEAQASGLPVVSTKHSGIPEVVRDGESGLLVPEGDAEGLAAAVVRLVREHASWPRIGAAGRMHVGRAFDVNESTEQLLGVYRFATAAYTHSCA
jgi:colanic acid/amylovoran biosynthesis glycosyltransferase